MRRIGVVAVLVTALLASAVTLSSAVSAKARPESWPVSADSTWSRTAAKIDIPKLDIDIHELDRGASPQVPWIIGKRIRHRGTTTPLRDTAVTSFAAMNGGFLVYQSHLGPRSPARIQLIDKAGKAKLLGSGAVSEPIVRDDGELASWTTVEPVRPPAAGHPPAQLRSRVHTAYAPDGRIDDVSGGPASDTAYRPVGYLDGPGVVLDSANDGIARAFDVESVSHLGWSDTTGAHATSRPASLAAFEKGTDDTGRTCTTVAMVDPLIGSTTDLWSSCTVRPISFSPTGRFAVAVDSDAADDGHRRLHVVSAESGTPLRTISVPRTERVVWESDNQLLLDAWDGAGPKAAMALVRCTVGHRERASASAGPCERATGIRPDDPTAPGRPTFLLAQR